VAGQVLDISKHESTVRTSRPQGAGKRARVYRFPAGKSELLPAPAAAIGKKSNFRVHVVVEIAIGLLFWLIWFVWHLLH
jgi:hypothetical protein